MSIAEQIKQVADELPPAQQRKVLDFVRSLQQQLADEESALGEMGARAAAHALEPEDFSDWREKTHG